MPIQMASYLIPKNGGQFYLLEDKYLKGGFRVVDDVAARDAIPTSMLKTGALVYAKAENTYYRYDADALSWTDIPLGVAGPVGPTGDPGVDGVDGIAGTDGPVGPTGPNGVQGATGAVGPTGDAGASGYGLNVGLLGQFPGAVTPLIGTIRYYPPVAITIVKAVAWLSAPADSTVAAVVRKNGLPLITISVLTGTSYREVDVSLPLLPTDYITIDIAAGVGSDLAIRLDY